MNKIDGKFEIVFKTKNFEEHNPYFTVFITDYINHSRFFRALNSVLDQDMPADLFEIIILTDDNKKKLDALPDDISLSIIFTGLVKYGKSIGNSLNFAKGEIICLLDNDDEWEKDKLKLLYSYFRNHSDVIFIKNEVKPVSDTKISPFMVFLKMNIPVKPSGKFYILDDSVPRSILGRALVHNNSSMSFRKCALLNELGFLREIDNLQDISLFIVAALSDGKLAFLDKALSLYYITSKKSPVKSQSVRDFEENGGSTAYGNNLDKFLQIIENKLMSCDKKYVKNIIFDFELVSIINLNSKTSTHRKIPIKDLSVFFIHGFRNHSVNKILLLLFYFFNSLANRKLNRLVGWRFVQQ